MLPADESSSVQCEPRQHRLSRIDTDRLILRPLIERDASDLCTLETGLDEKRFIGPPRPGDAESYRKRIAAAEGGWSTTLAVTLGANGSFIGRCGFTESFECNGWELNIVLLQKHWRSGYGKEIGTALIERGFDALKCDSIFGIVEAENTRSVALCEKLGMKIQPFFQFKRNHKPVRVYLARRSV